MLDEILDSVFVHFQHFKHIIEASQVLAVRILLSVIFSLPLSILVPFSQSSLGFLLLLRPFLPFCPSLLFASL